MCTLQASRLQRPHQTAHFFPAGPIMLRSSLMLAKFTPRIALRVPVTPMMQHSQRDLTKHTSNSICACTKILHSLARRLVQIMLTSTGPCLSTSAPHGIQRSTHGHPTRELSVALRR